MHNEYYSGEPDNSIYYSCSAIDPNGFNDARYCDPEVDRRSVHLFDCKRSGLIYLRSDPRLKSPRFTRVGNKERNGISPGLNGRISLGRAL